MTIYLIRHAHAGSRSKWVGRDELRPLDGKGRTQSDNMAAALAGTGLTHLVSSPFTRCVQTVRPLGDRTRLPVQTHPALAEGAPVTLGLALLQAHVRDTVAFCSHGDVIPNLLDALAGQGIDVDVGQNTRKGAWWILEADGDLFVRARYHPPLND